MIRKPDPSRCPPDGASGCSSTVAGRAAIIMILLLAAASLALAGLAAYHANAPTAPDAVEEGPAEHGLSESRIGALLGPAASVAERRALEVASAELEALFTPVHAAVPGYADFHYSILGEYIEMGELAFGSVSSNMEKRLFEGFDQRLDAATARIDTTFTSAFEKALYESAAAEVAAAESGAVLGDATKVILDDTVMRFATGKPVEAVVATGAASVGAKTVAATISKTFLKGLGKAVAKSAARPLSLGGGMAGGALAGSWAGPIGAAVGGAVGGAVTWFSMDYAIISIDELVSREVFEADLHALIDTERAQLEARIAEAISGHRIAVSGKTIDQASGAGPEKERSSAPTPGRP